MGFGSLFIGWLFLLNISYSGYTDLIAALLMLLGLTKLSSVNAGYRKAGWTCVGFAVFGLAQLVISLLSLFGISLSETGTAVLSAVRYLWIGATEFFFLLGTISVTKEVDLPKLTTKAQTYLPFPFVTCLSCALFEIPNLFPSSQATAVAAMAALFLHLIFTVLLLCLIYHCYAQICMPDDLDMEQKPSRFAFINRFREHEAQKNAEAAAYRQEKFLSKNQKKKRK